MKSRACRLNLDAAAAHHDTGGLNQVSAAGIRSLAHCITTLAQRITMVSQRNHSLLVRSRSRRWAPSRP
jgi:hypothetical protein